MPFGLQLADHDDGKHDVGSAKRKIALGSDSKTEVSKT